MKKNIDIAVIGLGNMGKHHARIFSSLDGVRLVAVSDINETLGQETAQRYGCVFYRNYIEMLEREEIDAVSVVVPTSLHKKICLEVIRCKKHLLVEKPIAATSKEAKAIIEAAKTCGVILTVGHIERFNSAVQELKKIIKKNGLGTISSIIARRVGIFPPQMKDANVTIDLGVHDIDIFNYLLDRQPNSVYALSRKALIDKREDSVEIFLSYEGASGFIQTNWITPIKIRTLSVTGSKGHAELNYITQSLEIYKSIYVTEVDDYGQFVVKFGQPLKEEINTDKGEPLLRELASFVDSIVKNKKPEVSGKEGLLALATAEGAIKSVKSNKVVRLTGPSRFARKNAPRK